MTAKEYLKLELAYIIHTENPRKLKWIRKNFELIAEIMHRYHNHKLTEK